MAGTVSQRAPSSMKQLLLVLPLLLMAEVVISDTGQWEGRSLGSHDSWYPSDEQGPQQQPQSQQDQQPPSASNGPTCTGVLIGIGTQKGGTTAAWTYIKHKAHPMLQVSTQKEVGFWDQVHGWYKGCTLGDYMMLLNGSVAHEPDQSLPLCPVSGTSGPMWAQNSNRLKSSKICGVRQKLVKNAGVAASDPAISSSSSSKPCSATEGYSKPWWWIWGGWHSGSAVTAEKFGQDGLLASEVSTEDSKNLVEASQISSRPTYQVDITPSYLYDSTAPLWVRSMLPEARILVILREPASRAVSNFNMKWQKLRDAELRRNDTSFLSLTPQQREAAWLEALRANATRQMQHLEACYSRIGTTALRQPELAACLGMRQPYSPTYQSALWEDAMIWQGIYADGLERWFKLFPANQFMVWNSEDFKADPAAHMRELISWLGLDSRDIHPKLLPGAKRLNPIHVREYEAEAPDDLQLAMQQFFAPHNERLFAVLQAKGFGSVAARMRQVWNQPDRAIAVATATAAAAADGGVAATAVTMGLQANFVVNQQ